MIVPRHEVPGPGVWTFTEGQVERFSPRAHCEMSRRDGAIVAWHEVPGRASSQESHPVGYGLIHAGERTDSSDWSDEISEHATFNIYVVSFLSRLP